ncbi:MAG: COX15/CtaA family protein [Actinomycetota bacterium]
MLRSPQAYRRLALLVLVLLVILVASGAAVRLTSSGLGCADWPACNENQLIDVSSRHAAIEQLNRLFSGLIGVPIVLLLVAGYRQRPRRPDLIRPLWAMFGLFVAEAVVGGLSVLLELAWFSVAAHFLLAMGIVALAALAVRRAAGAEPGAGAVPCEPWLRRSAGVILVGTLWVLVWGTLLTAAGPHGGDELADRLSWPIPTVARVHAISVDILVALVLVVTVIASRRRAAAPLLRALGWTMAAMVTQGTLGYVQYLRDIPASLVWFHVVGATLVTLAVFELAMTAGARGAGTKPQPIPIDSR